MLPSDILTYICSHLDPPSLTAFGQVCVAFRDASMDFEWRTVSHPDALLQLLHSDHNDDLDAYLDDSANLQWQTYFAHASRVRSIIWRDEQLSEDFVDISADLHQLLPVAEVPLLPRLQGASLTCTSGAALRACAHWLRPEITRLSLILDSAIDATDLAYFLDSLTGSCLERVSLMWNTQNASVHDIARVSHSLSQLLACQSDLQRVDVPIDILFLARPEASTSLWATLSELPELKQLIIFQRTSAIAINLQPAHFHSASPSVNVWPALDTISLAATPAEAAIIVSHASQKVKAVHIATSEPVYPQELSTALSQIARLHLHDFTFHATNDKGGPLAWDAFCLLAACTELERFEMRHPRALVLSDDDVQKIAKAWPKMRVLVLNPRPLPSGRIVSALPGLPSLITLLKQMPQLHRLGMFLREGEVLSLPRSGSQQHHAMRELDIGVRCETAAFRADLARLISTVCPRAWLRFR